MAVLTPAAIQARVAEVHRLRDLLERLPSGPDPERDSLYGSVSEWLDSVEGPLDSLSANLWAVTADDAGIWAAEIVSFLAKKGVTARYAFADLPGGGGLPKLPSLADAAWLVWGLAVAGVVYIVYRARK